MYSAKAYNDKSDLFEMSIGSAYASVSARDLV